MRSGAPPPLFQSRAVAKVVRRLAAGVAVGLLIPAAAWALVLPAAGTAPTAVRREAEIHRGVFEVEFSSRVLRAEKKLCVTAPAAARARSDGWPVLFLLHGRGRTHRSLVDLEPMRRAFLTAPFCTVFPQGDDCWYIDSPVEPLGRYEAYLEEVIALAAQLRPLTRSRDRRAITGWSMGGYGAVRFALPPLSL